MLNMGFQEDVEMILEDVPVQRQTLFFSATMPQWVQKLARKYCQDYTMVDLVGDQSTGPSPCSRLRTLHIHRLGGRTHAPSVAVAADTLGAHVLLRQWRPRVQGA